MDIKKLLEAHGDVKKCLKGDCGHKNLGKCMDKIAAAHEVIGDELKDEAEKMIRNLKGDIIQKKFEALDATDPDYVRKAANLVFSEPTLVD
jgi:hypothetical protein